MTETVLLLDGQTIQVISIAKQLKRKGYKVILFCDSKVSYGYRTKYADEKILSPSVHENPSLFLDFIVNYLKNKEIDILIPMNDYSASFLSENKQQLLQYTKFIIPNIDVFNKGYDKKQLMALCEDSNFPHPKTADLEVLSLVDAANKVGFPSLIKPNITTGGRGITLVNSKDELLKQYSDVRTKYGACHLQEFIPAGGRQLKVQLFVESNETIRYTSVIHKIRFYPENGGSSCCNVTVKEDSLVELCSQVLKKIGWIGFADFDLIEDPRDGIIKIMEINPRVPACIKSSIISGIDFGTIIADETLGKKQNQYVYTPGKYLRYFGLDLLWFVYSSNRFKAKPNWFRFWNKNVFYQEGGLDDWKPFLYGTVGGFIKQLNPKFRKEKAGMRG